MEVERTLNKSQHTKIILEKNILHCWIPPIQITYIDRAEIARCTLSVSFPTDLDYCVVFVAGSGISDNFASSSESISYQLRYRSS